nr:hypothetical protein [Luteolibacter pohnpeiensis]
MLKKLLMSSTVTSQSPFSKKLSLIKDELDVVEPELSVTALLLIFGRTACERFEQI